MSEYIVYDGKISRMSKGPAVTQIGATYLIKAGKQGGLKRTMILNAVDFPILQSLAAQRSPGRYPAYCPGHDHILFH